MAMCVNLLHVSQTNRRVLKILKWHFSDIDDVNEVCGLIYKPGSKYYGNFCEVLNTVGFFLI